VNTDQSCFQAATVHSALISR